jgi:hypothetical protein
MAVRAGAGIGAVMRNWVHPMPTPEAFAIDRILYDVQHDRTEETRYFADPAKYLEGHPALTDPARDALARTDVGRLYLLGANPYLLRAYCLQLRMSEPDYLGALRAVGGELRHG